MLIGLVSVVSKYADVRDHSHKFSGLFGNGWHCYTEVGMVKLQLAVPLKRCGAPRATHRNGRGQQSSHTGPCFAIITPSGLGAAK